MISNKQLIDNEFDKMVKLGYMTEEDVSRAKAAAAIFGLTVLGVETVGNFLKNHPVGTALVLWFAAGVWIYLGKNN